MAVTFTQDTFISFSDLSYEGADVVITNCTLTVDGPHIFHSLLVQNAGVLTHSPNTNGPQQLTLLVSNEPHVMSATNPPTLFNQNVDPNTVTVLNASKTTIYTEGVDYFVTFPNQFAQLNLTTNSAIAEGATVLVSYDWRQSIQGFTLFINNGVNVQAGGKIDASGQGYAGGTGISSGVSQSTNYPFSFSAGGSGGHGGAGGLSSTFAHGGASYDSTTNPASLGSGGGTGSNPGGAGGGSAAILVDENFQIDGLVAAGGLKATNAHSGGGAGGGLFLSADSFSGAGTISANGGGGDTPDGGGGGGGRIALFFATNQFTGAMTAFGGGGFMAGGAGTIYLQADSDPAGQLLIVNAGQRGTNTTFAAPISDLTISGGAIAQPALQPVNLPALRITNLFIGSNSWLRSRDSALFLVTVAGNATVESNALITADFESLAGSGSGVASCGAGPGASYGGVGGTSVCGGTFRYGLRIHFTTHEHGKLGSGSRLSANGITAVSNLNSGGGGGGRVAVWANTNQFTGVVSARGGTGANTGGAGTVFLNASMTSVRAPSRLILDNGNAQGASTLINSSVSQADVLITNGTSVALGMSTSGAATWNSLTIASNLDIQAGGALSLDRQGSPVNAGLGHGYSATGSGGGGGHGGLGNAGVSTNALGGPSFDSLFNPVILGSGGGSTVATTGSAGGGVIQLNVTRTLNVNGGDATTAGAGGGSGGSISVIAGYISGHGKISARTAVTAIFSPAAAARAAASLSPSTVIRSPESFPRVAVRAQFSPMARAAAPAEVFGSPLPNSRAPVC